MPPKSKLRRNLPIILTIPGAILAALLIWGIFYPKEPSITAIGECSPFSLPDNVYIQIQTLGTNPEFDEILKLLPDKTPDRVTTAAAIQDSFTKDKPKNLEDNVRRWTSFCRFVVSNTGTKEAQDLRLQYRNSGIFRLERAGEKNKSDSWENAISVGNLQPGNELRITSWNNSYFTEPNALFDKISVSYSEGNVPVEFPKRTLTSYLTERQLNFPVSLGFGVVGAFLFIMGFLLGAFARRVRLVKSDSGELLAVEEPSNTTSEKHS